MSAALTEGSLFAGRYRVVRRIATGGMGAVYEVVHLETDRRRALKVMLPEVLHDEELRSRFQREARVTANVESEFIVEVFDAGIDAESQMPFLVMELLRGEELSKRLRRLKRLTPREVLTYMHQTAIALDRTHARAIVHRDLKPANIFLTQRDDGSPRVKVLDFGIAKLVADGNHTHATKAIGTPLYMAPEQLKPGGVVSAATDLYALGLITYTLLVGVAYWDEDLKSSESVFGFALTAMAGPKEPASERAARRGATLPAGFDAWFAKMCAADPAARYPDAATATRDLAEVLGVGDASASVRIEAPVVPAPAIDDPTTPWKPVPGSGREVASSSSGVRAHGASSGASAPNGVTGDDPADRSYGTAAPLALPHPPSSRAPVGVAIAVSALLAGGAAAVALTSRGAPPAPEPASSSAPAAARPPPTARASTAPSATPPEPTVTPVGAPVPTASAVASAKAPPKVSTKPAARTVTAPPPTPGPGQGQGKYSRD